MAFDHFQFLTNDARWNIFLALGDVELRAVACSQRDLLSECTCACLHLYLARLNSRYRNLLALPRRLCPGGGDGWSGKSQKSIQHVLRQLSHVAAQGDQASLAIALPWIQWGDSATRATAIRSVSKIAVKGDRRVIDTVLRGLCAGSDIEASCDALQTLVFKGDSEVVGRIHGLLSTDNSNVMLRHAALQALPSVVERGNEVILETLFLHAEDKNDMVRAAALRALGQLALEGDRKAITCMLRALRDGSASIRRAAMDALHITSGGSFTASDVSDVSLLAKAAMIVGHREKDVLQGDCGVTSNTFVHASCDAPGYQREVHSQAFARGPPAPRRHGGRAPRKRGCPS